MRAHYQFPGAESPYETAFFGLALSRHLQPDRVIVLGTEGSQWSVLVENLATDDARNSRQDDEEFQARVELIDAEAEKRVNQELLDRVSALLTNGIRRAAGLSQVEVLPQLIPYGRDELEQYAILNIIADAVPNGDVSFDLTHGFRHMGMVGFLSAFMLERVRRLKVRSMWYGALDMTQKRIAPVIQLDGLTRVRRWIDALGRFDTTGDYGVFAPLLVEDGVPQDKANCLKKAAFYESTLNISDAARQLRVFRPVTEDGLSGASGLFRNLLLERIGWTEAVDLAARQRQLAREHLKRRNYLHAAVFGFESFVTMQCDQRGFSAGNYESGRTPARKEFEKEASLHQHPKRATHYWNLQTIRNSLAHAAPPPNRHYQNLLKNSSRLHRALEDAFDALLD